MKTIRYYAGIYRLFLSTSLSVALSFRSSFMLLILMEILFYFSIILSGNFLFDHISTLGPWSRYELLFFLSFMLSVDAIHMAVFSSNFWMLGHKIQSGELDFDLLKPAHSIFVSFFRIIKPSSFLASSIAFSFLIYYGNKVNLEWFDWPMIPPLIFCALSLLCLLEFIMASSMFWLIEGMGVNFLRMQMQQLARWPDFIYKFTYQKIFTFGIPLLLIGSAPVHFILDKSKWPYLLGISLAIFVSGFLLIKVWDKALHQYDSASS